MKENVKIGVQILYFDSEQFILNTIENCASFVDKIYILYSELPWTYNKKARERYKNESSLDILEKSSFTSKIQILVGVFDTEEEQRNDGLEKARKDGMDFLIIQDPDEFYSSDDYKSNVRQMISNPEYLYYRTPWYIFWKKLNYVIQFKEVHGKKNTIINFCAAFALNCHKEVYFTKNRLVNTTDASFLDKPCYHLSFYVSDDQLIRKINTWGHAGQIIDKKKWFRYKWLHWTPGTKNINPFNPISWSRAVKFNGHLPEEIKRIPIPDQKSVNITLWQKIDENIYDFKGHLFYYFNTFKTNLNKAFGQF